MTHTRPLQHATVLANLTEERARNARHDQRLSYVYRGMNFLQSIALIAFGVWCYTFRHQIQAFLMSTLAP